MEIIELICHNPNCINPRRYDLEPQDFNKNRSNCRQCDGARAIRYKEKKWQKCKVIIDEYLGNKCEICGETDDSLLRAHEKFGKPHKKLMDTTLKEVRKNCEIGRFVRVCEKCHRKSHALIKDGIDGWETIKNDIKRFYDTNPPKETAAHHRAWQKYRKILANKGQLSFDDSLFPENVMKLNYKEIY